MLGGHNRQTQSMLVQLSTLGNPEGCCYALAAVIAKPCRCTWRPASPCGQCSQHSHHWRSRLAHQLLGVHQQLQQCGPHHGDLCLSSLRTQLPLHRAGQALQG